jgi:membrane associated rhomboid family serine protease
MEINFPSVAFFATSGMFGGYVLRLAKLPRYVEPHVCMPGKSGALYAMFTAYAVAPHDRMWMIPVVLRVDMATYAGLYVATDIWGIFFNARSQS